MTICIFRMNGYNDIFFDKVFMSFQIRNSINETQSCTLKDNNFKHIIKIPFVGKVSYEFKNKLTKLFSHHLRVDIYLFSLR